MTTNFDSKKALDLLNHIMEAELAGVVRYTHYSLMIFGYNRIPIVSWMREQANESMMHAQEAGELITHIGGHPSLAIGNLLESHKHDIKDILKESLQHERATLDLYYQLHDLVANKSILLEEYARKMISQEEMHISDVDKMLRSPGDIHPFKS
jgi:bacterioferritin